jgi:hypothetical protein
MPHRQVSVPAQSTQTQLGQWLPLLDFVVQAAKLLEIAAFAQWL